MGVPLFARIRMNVHYREIFGFFQAAESIVYTWQRVDIFDRDIIQFYIVYAKSVRDIFLFNEYDR